MVMAAKPVSDATSMAASRMASLVAARCLSRMLRAADPDVEDDLSSIGDSLSQKGGGLSRVSRDVVTGMLEIYPDWGNLHTVWHSAKAAMDRKDC
jgi:hypothetical protein